MAAIRSVRRLRIERSTRRRRRGWRAAARPVGVAAARRVGSPAGAREARGGRALLIGAPSVAVAEAVADAPYREQVLGLLGVQLDLLAQVADVHVDRARVAVRRVAPDA